MKSLEERIKYRKKTREQEEKLQEVADEAARAGVPGTEDSGKKSDSKSEEKK